MVRDAGSGVWLEKSPLFCARFLMNTDYSKVYRGTRRVVLGGQAGEQGIESEGAQLHYRDIILGF